MKKNLKKAMAMGLATTMALAAPAAVSAAGNTSDVSGSHVFMFKSVGNAFGVIMYEGFSSYMEQVGENCTEKSPAETTVAAQVQLIDEAITQDANPSPFLQMVIQDLMKYLQKLRKRVFRSCPLTLLHLLIIV